MGLAHTAATPTAREGKLLRILGVSFGVAVTVGGTIGVGILRTPGMVAAHLGSAWLIIAVWVVGGVYVLLGAIAVAELGTMLPRAGGWYVYARRAFGKYGGFAVGWSDWIAQCTALAYLTTSMGEFSAALVPALSGSVKVVAITTLLLFALLQWMGLRMSSRAQEVTSLVKAAAFLGLVAACFVFGGETPPSDGQQSMLSSPAASSALLVGLVIALQSVIVTYDGWYSAIYFTEEDRDPARNLPRSAIGGVSSTIAIYVLVNLGLLYVLPVPQLAASQLPVADAAERIFGAYSGQVITGLALVSLPSVVNAVLLLATRILFAMSRDNLFLSRGAAVNAAGTPGVAMFLSTLAGVVLVASGTFEKLIAIAAVFCAAIYSAGFVSLFVLRKREPVLARPFRAWGYPWTTLIVLIASLLFLFGNMLSDVANSVCALALIALSYPVYLVVVKLRRGATICSER